jgi:hypothetical protein
MPETSVGFSRAGDVFHYRWAARRCLRLVYPNATVSTIQVEGTLEQIKAGEDVIDLTEYESTKEGGRKVSYYQLKHTSVQHGTPFQLSDLAETLAGFAKKYVQIKADYSGKVLPEISFALITNRPVNPSLRTNLVAIAQKQPVEDRFRVTIEKYTQITEDELAAFCNLVTLQDSEGNYQAQAALLRSELGALLAGTVDNTVVESLVALVQTKLLPHEDGTITRESVLQRMGVTSSRELYPAPAAWEKVETILPRDQYAKLLTDIGQSSQPVIVHAAGGVGKSVFCQYLQTAMPEGSVAIAYDCFGAGGYRNLSETRHRHKDALVQMANELAAKGWCEPLLPVNRPSEEDLMRRFLLLLRQAVDAIRKINGSGQLYLVVDAADNAEMAAQERNQDCFAHELLAETIPTGCKLVMLCRTERMALLKPKSYIRPFVIEPFTEEETGKNLRQIFADVRADDVTEFFRLTAGNPRVQATAISNRYTSIGALLSSLGPDPLSVDQQISNQIKASVSRVKDALPEIHQQQIDAICLGLAILPPHIPLAVLSLVAGVDATTIISFVADIGPALWLSDNSLQIRDEPTETWFRETYLGSRQVFETYISLLEPHSERLTYVAEVLPQLYLQAGQYDKLIRMALSDDGLPAENPIDSRNIRVYRLQFAFRAALRSFHLKDAAKLALRAGEESAGNERQLGLFKRNTDLVARLQSPGKVQEIAFRRILSGGWDGSENVYAASLLSGLEAYRGEARGYLRAAENWLILYYQQLSKDQSHVRSDAVSDNDLLEFGFACLNLLGVDVCVDFLRQFRAKTRMFHVVQRFIRKLLDAGKLDVVQQFLQQSRHDVFFVVAATSELVRLGEYPTKQVVADCLVLLCSARSRIPVPKQTFKDKIVPGIIAFTEACLHYHLDARKIDRVLRHYVPKVASHMVGNARYSDDRSTFLRGLAIRNFLAGRPALDIAVLAPQLKEGEDHFDNEQKLLRESIEGMFPWYSLRARLLVERDLPVMDLMAHANATSKKVRDNRYIQDDILPVEIAGICAEILVLFDWVTPQELDGLVTSYLENNNSLDMDDHITLVWAAYRRPHLRPIRDKLEGWAYRQIKIVEADSPEDRADRYIRLARAVLLENPADAGIYFNDAIEAVSKFGEEMVRRWEAIVALANQAGPSSHKTQEMAYRFIRCAEFVGNRVAREKHWDRCHAVVTCAGMFPGVALSAVSRWREAAIEEDSYLLANVLIYLLEEGQIGAETAWALSRLFETGDRLGFLSDCLKHTNSSMVKQSIFDDAIERIRQEGSLTRNRKRLAQLSTEHALFNPWIPSSGFSPATHSPEAAATPAEETTAFWDAVFDGVHLDGASGLQEAFERYKEKAEAGTLPVAIRKFLREALLRLHLSQLPGFTRTLLHMQEVNRYDVEEILTQVPTEWKNRPSFPATWSAVIRKVGERFAEEWCRVYSYDAPLKKLLSGTSSERDFTAGIVDGLSSREEFSDEEVYFGFVRMTASSLSADEAADALTYALSRFELHIPPSYGDGPWSDWLTVEETPTTILAGYLWCALGAPDAAVRWQAAHSVRKLAEYHVLPVLHKLIELMSSRQAGAFCRKNFVFYHWHARVYLLIAIDRIAIDHSDTIVSFGPVFSHYAIAGDHLLVQNFASQIVTRLESAYPGTFDKKDLEGSQQAVRSPFEITVKKPDYKGGSGRGPKEPKAKPAFEFDWDMEGYWLQSLARVFGISLAKLENLISAIIYQEWTMAGGSGSLSDGRTEVWNGMRRYSDTSYDHGSYPKVDRLIFYCFYHAMMVVASRLVKELPVIQIRRSDPEGSWEGWMNRHRLTRSDGRWLADNRSAVPHERPDWVFQPLDATWQDAIDEAAFAPCLYDLDPPEDWITVAGSWQERKDDWSESYTVSSAFVSQATSNEFTRALVNDAKSHRFTLPESGETEMEIGSTSYPLQPWIHRQYVHKGFDEFDPYADAGNYPPYTPEEDFLTQFGLVSNDCGNAWATKESKDPSLYHLSWMSLPENRDKDADQSGTKLRSSRAFIRTACEELDCDLILVVEIERSRPHRRGDYDYVPPRHKVFRFSASGRLSVIEPDSLPDRIL